MRSMTTPTLALALFCFLFAGCGTEEEPAFIRIKNDFDNETFAFQPPWTICESSYLGEEFGSIGWGEISEEREIEPGLGHVLMVAAWDDPDCTPERSLPIASREEEEVLPGQQRTIHINLPNHQGACPPEGTQPIPESLYEQIRTLWPDYGFKPYEERTENTQCRDDE